MCHWHCCLSLMFDCCVMWCHNCSATYLLEVILGVMKLSCQVFLCWRRTGIFAGLVYALGLCPVLSLVKLLISLGMLAGLLHRIVLHEALLVVTTNKEGIGPRAPHSHGFHQQLHLLPMDISKLPNIWVCHHSMQDHHNHMVDTLNSQLLAMHLAGINALLLHQHKHSHRAHTTTMDSKDNW